MGDQQADCVMVVSCLGCHTADAARGCCCNADTVSPSINTMVGCYRSRLGRCHRAHWVGHASKFPTQAVHTSLVPTQVGDAPWRHGCGVHLGLQLRYGRHRRQRVGRAHPLLGQRPISRVEKLVVLCDKTSESVSVHAPPRTLALPAVCAFFGRRPPYLASSLASCSFSISAAVFCPDAAACDDGWVCEWTHLPRPALCKPCKPAVAPQKVPDQPSGCV